MTMIANQRGRFEMPRNVHYLNCAYHYLNCAYMSPLAETVRAAMAAKAGIDMLLEWGVQAVCDTFAVKTNALADATSAYAPRISCHSCSWLAAANVYVSLRVTPACV